VSSLREKVSPEPGEPKDVRDLGGPIGLGMGDQARHEQMDRHATTETFCQVPRLDGRNHGVVPAVKQEDRD
jgi:hypothetical protein